jgi:hypothetical protein
MRLSVASLRRMVKRPATHKGRPCPDRPQPGDPGPVPSDPGPAWADPGPRDHWLRAPVVHGEDRPPPAGCPPTPHAAEGQGGTEGRGSGVGPGTLRGRESSGPTRPVTSAARLERPELDEQRPAAPASQQRCDRTPRRGPRTPASASRAPVALHPTTTTPRDMAARGETERPTGGRVAPRAALRGGADGRGQEDRRNGRVGQRRRGRLGPPSHRIRPLFRTGTREVCLPASGCGPPQPLTARG